MALASYAPGLLSGGLVGFTLGLVGGGGSILAVPLNALVNLIPHARAGNVKWRCGGIYASSGVIGALVGSTLGKAFDGQKLLFYSP